MIKVDLIKFAQRWGRLRTHRTDEGNIKLQDVDLTILDEIAAQKVLVTAKFLHKRTPLKKHCSEKTLKKRLRNLEKRGFIERPDGKNSGYQITSTGKEYLNRIDDVPSDKD